MVLVRRARTFGYLWTVALLKMLSQTDPIIDDRFAIGGAQHALAERAGSTGAVSDWFTATARS